MNGYPANNQQNGKSPVGPAKKQVRGFRGMPKPDEVIPMTQQAGKEASPQAGASVATSTQEEIQGVRRPATSSVQDQQPSPAAQYARRISQAPEQIAEKRARPAVRTFKNDATSYMKEQNITATQIALAEQKKQQEALALQDAQPKTSRKVWIILITVLLLLIGIVGVAIVFLNPNLSLFRSNTVDVQQVQSPLQTISNNPQTEFITLDRSLSYLEIDLFFDRLLRRESGAYMFIEETVDGREELIFPDDFFRYVRFFDLQEISFAFKNIEYGVQSGSPYLLFETNDFPKAYPRMFVWEEDMIEQLEPLFPELRRREVTEAILVEEDPQEVISGAQEAPITSETQETNDTEEDDGRVEQSTEDQENVSGFTEEQEAVVREQVITTTIDFRNLTFTDALVENQSVRVALDTEGKPILYYTFIADQYILIAQDLEMLPVIIDTLQ